MCVVPLMRVAQAAHMRIFSIGLLAAGLAAIALTGWWQATNVARNVAAGLETARATDYLTRNLPAAATITGDDTGAARQVAMMKAEVATLRRELVELRTLTSDEIARCVGASQTTDR